MTIDFLYALISAAGEKLLQYYRKGGSGVRGRYLEVMEVAAKHDPIISPIFHEPDPDANFTIVAERVEDRWNGK